MDELLISALGPYHHVAFVLGPLLVWLNRRSLRRGHVAALLGLTVLAVVAFFAAMFFALAGWIGPLLFWTGYYASAAVAVACAPATLLAALLVGIRPAGEASRSAPASPANRRRDKNGAGT